MIQAIDLDKLSHAINQLFDSLCQFENILDTEKEILKSSELSSLNDITTQKETLSNQIEQAFNALNQLLSSKIKSLNQLINAEGFKNFPKALQTRITETAEKVVHCSDKNLANGMSIQALSNINQTVLHLLQGQDPQSKVYSATGESKNTGGKSRTLGKA